MKPDRHLKIKNLYLNAVKSLYSDNFFYFYKLMDTSFITLLCKKVSYICTADSVIKLYDFYGCCSDSVIKYITEKHPLQDVFLFEDDLCPGCFMAAYIAGKGIFLYSSRTALPDDTGYINASGYLSATRGRYYPQQYLDIAAGYLKKRGGIDKRYTL